MDDYADYDGLGLADLVSRRRVSPVELVDAAIARIERHNPTLNAVVYTAFDEARRRAAGDLPDGPFKGVPFLIKDLGMPVAGWPNSHGSRFARDVVPAGRRPRWLPGWSRWPTPRTASAPSASRPPAAGWWA